MFEQTFKNIDDILHKDAGCSSELDYVEQTSLRKFKTNAESADTIEYKIGEIFNELKNKIQSGYNLREVINLIDELRFRSSAEKHEMSHLCEDKINADIYKERADLLRNEEKKLKQDVKAVQIKILEKRNAVNLVKATQDFLVRLRSNPKDEQKDYLVKSFMRIIFKAVYIQNQEIVKVEINEPWKMCYEEGLKWQKKSETTPIQANPRANRVMESLPVRQAGVYFCAPSDGRWQSYSNAMRSLAEAVVGE